MNKSCVVVIPVYRTLDEDEVMVVNQVLRMTPGFDKVFITSYSFQFDDSYANFEDIRVERFDDCFFEGIKGYNQLMLSIDFYKRFDAYQYMLIHQTDAYLFKDELKYWCDKNYAYIGAPWYYPDKLKKYNKHRFLSKYCKFFYKKRQLLRMLHYNNVGNGGLSLRNVVSFINVLECVKPQLLSQYINNSENNPSFNEDMFWSIEAPQINRGFRIPKWDEATYFSVENSPLESYNFMNRTLPFGCHGFKRNFSIFFWLRFVPFKLLPEL